MLLRKTFRFLDRCMNWIEGILCLFLVVCALYCVYDAILVYQSAGDAGLLRFKPGYEGDASGGKDILKDEMVGWLTVDDTTIDYPVMQGEDNAKFVNTNPYGEYSFSGSIFLDSRNSRDFSDPYNLIYGHHMNHGYMFGALDAFLDKDYLLSHKKATLTVGKTVHDYTILASMSVSASSREIFAPTEVANDAIIAYVRQNASVIVPEFDTAVEGKTILACSTCKSPDTADRTVVFGVVN